MRFSMITLGGLLLAAATPAMAQDEAAPAEESTPAFKITGGVTVTSDYRFRGVSQSGKDPALQGTINVNHESGLYAGVWASTIDEFDSPVVAGYGKAEIDLYGGFTKTFSNGLGVDVGLLYYVYPIQESLASTDFFEPYASVSYTAGPVTGKVGANYVWSGQNATIGASDSLYLRGDVTVAIPHTPISVLGHVGHSDGSLGVLALTKDHYLDWSLGVEASHKFVKIGVQYVDTNITDVSLPIIGKYDKALGANPTVLGYLTLSF